MTLLLDGRGMLPPKRHRATEDEIRALFVDAAPFPKERALLWDAFLVYRSIARDLMPSVKFWIDGGFVTHKTWAAPKDIDVVMIADETEFLGVYTQLEPLLTVPDGPVRFQPMGGKIDGFVALSGHPEDVPYWAWQWSRVRDSDGNTVEDQRKGYVEVMYA